MKPLTYKLFFDETDDDDFGHDEYWDDGNGAAGCVFVAKSTGRILLAHRCPEGDEIHGVVNEPDTWATWGGKIDYGESPKDAVVREVEEETGCDQEYKLAYLWTFKDPSEGFQYHNFLAIVQDEFTPKRSWENDYGKWVEFGKWPRPMHFGLAALLKNAGEKIHRVVTLIKRKHAGIVEAMDTPPAIVQPAPNATANYNITNAYIVAATLWGEARGEGEQGMQAVMNVIMNRANGKFDKAHKIVLMPKQFSVWNSVTNAQETVLAMAQRNRADEQWQQAIRIVDLAAEGKLPDITGGAMFYFNPKKANPSWAKKLVKTKTIGNHVFYKVPPPRKKVKGKVPQAIREMIEKQNPNDATVFKGALVGDGLWEYEMRSPFSNIKYRYEPDTKTFYLDNIATSNPEHQGKGHATALLETFFRLIKQYGGALDCDTYTTSGMEKIKPVVERFAKRYGVRIVQGRIDELLTEDVYEYFYHATLPENLPNIVQRGLLPSKDPHWGGDLGEFSQGKVLVTNKFRQANYYGNVLWRNYPNRYRPILRFKYNKLRFIPDKKSEGDFYVEYPIKARFEIFVYDHTTKMEVDQNHGDLWFKENSGKWRPLTMDLAHSIETGEWDGDEMVFDDEDDVDNPNESGKIRENMLLMEARATPKQLVEFLREQIKGTEWQGKVFAVGGFVRDELLGKEPKDLDVVVGKFQGGVEFTTWLGKKLGIYKEKTNPVIYPTFGTANLRLDGVVWNGVDFTGEAIDAVMFRKEQYHDPNTRKPTVQYTDDIRVDASRRDITFNSLYKDIATGQVLDPTGKGFEDLKSGIVRTAIDPTIIYTDDALRMFRAVRFAAQLNFKLSPEILDGIKKNLHRLNNTSKERVRDELNKILTSKHPDYGLKLLNDTGLLPHLSPDLQKMVGMRQNIHHVDDVFNHTIAVIMGTQPELVRRLIALFHDIGKVATYSETPTGVHFYGHEMAGPDIIEKVMMDLKYPRVLIDAVKLGTRHHMKLKHGGDDAVKLSDKSLRQFKIAVGEYLEHILDVIHADNVSHADASAMPKQIEAVRQRLKNLNVTVTKPNLPINGNDLIAIGIKPGPAIGKIMAAVTDKWFENPNITKDDAMAIVKSMI